MLYKLMRFQTCIAYTHYGRHNFIVLLPANVGKLDPHSVRVLN